MIQITNRIHWHMQPMPNNTTCRRKIGRSPVNVWFKIR